MSKKERQYDEEGRVIRENRSQLKRERAEIKKFAETLLQLPARQFPLLPINDHLVSALREGQRLSGNALKRHLNYLTRLIEEQDFFTIQQAHEHINHPYLHSNQKGQRIQLEITRLISGDPDILGELFARYEDFNLQYVRQLVREIQKYEQEKSTLAASNPDTPVDKSVSKHQRQLQKYLNSLSLQFDSNQPY